MKYEDLEKAKTIIDYLESHNKNYNNSQYYMILDLQEILQEELKKITNSKNFIKMRLRDFILNDGDFKKCFECNYKTYNEGKLTFKQYTKIIVDLIFEDCQEELYLDKTYLDISYLIINDKIINLDFVYDIFNDYMKD